MATFKAVVFSTPKHIKNDGTTNIKIRVYHNKLSQYIPTDIYIPPQYLAPSGEVLESYYDADIINLEIGDIIQTYRKIAVKLGSGRLRQMSCKDLKNHIIDKELNNDSIDFVAFSNTVIIETKKEGTAEWYDTSLKVLQWFYNSEIIDVREITSMKLTEFMKQLAIKGPKGKPLESGGISNYVRAIRSLFNKCLLHYNNEELDIIKIPHDPFKKTKIPKYKRKRKNIGIDEIKMIRDMQFDTFRQQLARDVFMMMFYLMGINVKDLFTLQPPVNGRIEYERAKTDTDENVNNFRLSIKIEPELQILIDKYSQNGFLSTIKERYCHSYNFMKAVNRGFKKICEDNGLVKITSNWARHSWASLARNKARISKADIDFCLGHVNNDYKMADIYIDIDYSIYDEINRKVLDLLK